MKVYFFTYLLGGRERSVGHHSDFVPFSFSIPVFLLSLALLGLTKDKVVPAEGAGHLNHTTGIPPLALDTMVHPLSLKTTVEALLTPPHLIGDRRKYVGDAGPQFLPASLSVTAVFLKQLMRGKVQTNTWKH